MSDWHRQQACQLSQQQPPERVRLQSCQQHTAAGRLMPLWHHPPNVSCLVHSTLSTGTLFPSFFGAHLRHSFLPMLSQCISSCSKNLAAGPTNLNPVFRLS